MLTHDSEFVTVRGNGIHVYSYFMNFIQKLKGNLKTSLSTWEPVHVTGDFNARLVAWGDWDPDIQGEKLRSLFDSLGLLFLNESAKLTHS